MHYTSAEVRERKERGETEWERRKGMIQRLGVVREGTECERTRRDEEQKYRETTECRRPEITEETSYDW